MWYCLEVQSRNPTAILVQAESTNGARVAALVNGFGAMETAVARAIPLPGLKDQIPREYLERRLDIGDLRELDIYMGGDGTGTVPASARKVPWAS